HTQNIKQLQEGIDDFLVMYNIEPKSPVSFTFSDIERIRDTTIQLYLSKEEKKWEDRGGKGKMQFREYWTKKYSDLLEWFPNNIAYIALPLMVSKKEEPDYFEWFNEKIQEIQKESKALIIDIRDNPGGSRDLLQYLGNYFISPSRTTYVANIAQLRIDTSDNRDISELIMRGLYSSTSPSFDTSQRTVIKDFNECFKPFKSYDKTKFSDYYYMLLNPNFFSKKDHYDRPIFILINENSFSAASVFAGALKGLENIVLVGVCTDGSSGLTRIYKLKRSGIQIRFSRMLSFQPNGKLFDGNGTEPDIVIERSINQILGKEDYQLIKVLSIINGNNINF
ncbi:MAG: S41 family peptidase, partial [Bacteroidota bacterium]